MTVARQIVPGRTYLLSRRCTQRQFFLTPDEHGEVEQIYLYCLAEAAQRYGVTLHGFVAMSNHQHVLARDNCGNFPKFVAHLDKMIAKAMNKRLGRGENFWATEQPNMVYLVEAADRFDKLIYVLANPVAADLVDEVSDWPGACSLGLHLSPGTVMITRPSGYFRANGNMPGEVPLHIERPDGFEELSDAEWIAKVRDAVTAKEEQAREDRLSAGRGVLGATAIMAADPTRTPTTVATRGGLRPNIACLNPTRRIEELTALVAFREQRTIAIGRVLAGESDVIFPLGTYRVWGLFRSAPPPLIAAAA